mmetsp:Transcript_1268/g.3152  ORF Transcript_1268/g.3152 Transcript_1268/m.3152 type:complete len:258 (-) Transcript_1268:90-863(-)
MTVAVPPIATKSGLDIAPRTDHRCLHSHPKPPTSGAHQGLSPRPSSTRRCRVGRSGRTSTTVSATSDRRTTTPRRPGSGPAEETASRRFRSRATSRRTPGGRVATTTTGRMIRLGRRCTLFRAVSADRPSARASSWRIARRRCQLVRHRPPPPESRPVASSWRRPSKHCHPSVDDQRRRTTAAVDDNVVLPPRLRIPHRLPRIHTIPCDLRTAPARPRTAPMPSAPTSSMRSDGIASSASASPLSSSASSSGGGNNA